LYDSPAQVEEIGRTPELHLLFDAFVGLFVGLRFASSGSIFREARILFVLGQCTKITFGKNMSDMTDRQLRTMIADVAANFTVGDSANTNMIGGTIPRHWTLLRVQKPTYRISLFAVLRWAERRASIVQ